MSVPGPKVRIATGSRISLPSDGESRVRRESVVTAMGAARTGRVKGEVAFTLALLGIFGTLFGVAWGYPKQPRELPLLVSGTVIALLLFRLGRLLWSKAGTLRPPDVNWGAVGLIFGIILAFVGLVWLIGLIPAAPFLLLGLGVALGGRDRVRLVLVTVAVVGGVYLVFVRGLGVLFPRGVLFGG